MRGQFEPLGGSDQVFSLSRLQITCCRNDVTTLRVPVIAKQSAAGFSKGQWVKVTGHVEFRERGGAFQTVLIVSKVDAADPTKSDVVPVAPDPDPYVQ